MVLKCEIKLVEFISKNNFIPKNVFYKGHVFNKLDNSIEKNFEKDF